MASTLEVDGTKLYYEDTGEGDPVVLIHGAASSGRQFDEVLPSLAKNYRLIVPDLRGLGRSARIQALPSPRVWVEDVWAMLDHAGVSRVDLIGVSLGSRIAGRLALESPNRVRSLTVDAPIINLSSNGNASLKASFASFPEVDEDSEHAQQLRRMHGDDWREVVAFYARARASDGFQEYYTLGDSVVDIVVPTLILRGDFEDGVHPLADAVYWHQHAPSTELFIAPGLTQHSVIRERPADFVAAFDRFIEQVNLAA